MLLVSLGVLNGLLLLPVLLSFVGPRSEVFIPSHTLVTVLLLLISKQAADVDF